MQVLNYRNLQDEQQKQSQEVHSHEETSYERIIHSNHNLTASIDLVYLMIREGNEVAAPLTHFDPCSWNKEGYHSNY